MSITPANTHPLWDPSWASLQITKRYAAQLQLGDELTRYGADLLLRALQSAPDDVPHHIVLSVLFRQVIAALDAGMVCLRQGAVSAATIHVRGILEAGWGLAFALTDPAKWGAHVYVTSLREQRVWAARLIPGTDEYVDYADARQLMGAAGAVDAAREAELQQYVAATDAVLAKAAYASINQMYAHEVRHHNWYFDAAAPKAARVTSIAKLADAVGCRAEYRTIYRHASHYVHGAFTGSHLVLDERGAALHHLRTPEEWRQTFLLLVARAVDAYRRVIDEFRPGEVDQYVRRYVEQWRMIIQSTPEVMVILDRFANR